MKASHGQTEEQNGLMTVTDVAGYLGISKSSVYRMIEKRVIPFYKIRSGVRFERSDITTYLNQCRYEAFNHENDYGGTKN